MKKSLILEDSCTLQDALTILDSNGNGTLTIIDKNNRLVGLITDGDIRRGLLNKKTELKDFINFNPIILKGNISKKQAEQYLRQNHIRQIIIVNDENILQEVYVIDDFEILNRKNDVVIMAGGLGSRLGELTEKTPKPMLKVGEKPILEYIIENFKYYGFTNITLCVNHMSQIIHDYFGDGSKYGVKINYINESKRMGTAGALSLMKNKATDPFFVVNGDVLSTIDFNAFINFHIDTKSQATMCIKRYTYQLPYANAKTDDRNNIYEIKEKPIYTFQVNTGIYLMNPITLNFIPESTYYDMPMLFKELIKRKITVKAFSVDSDYWKDIGFKEDYHEAINDFESQ